MTKEIDGQTYNKMVDNTIAKWTNIIEIYLIENKNLSETEERKIRSLKHLLSEIVSRGHAISGRWYYECNAMMENCYDDLMELKNKRFIS